MKTENAPNSKNIQSASDEVKKPAVQYILSVSLGILTIVSLAASYYYGIIRF